MDKQKGKQGKKDEGMKMSGPAGKDGKMDKPSAQKKQGKKNPR